MPSEIERNEQVANALRAAGVPDDKIQDALDIAEEAFGERQDFTVPTLPRPLQPSIDPYAASSWGQPDEFDLVTPSGQRCRLKRLDPIDLAGAGYLEKLDTLTGIVTGEHIPNANLSPAAQAKRLRELAEKGDVVEGARSDAFTNMMKDPKQLIKFKEMLNDIMLMVVVAPELHPVPPANSERVNGRVYVDSVPFNDRMAIFNKVLGSVSKLDSFREEAEKPLGTVAHVEGVQQPPE